MTRVRGRLWPVGYKHGVGVEVQSRQTNEEFAESLFFRHEPVKLFGEPIMFLFHNADLAQTFGTRVNQHKIDDTTTRPSRPSQSHERTVSPIDMHLTTFCSRP